ncbi:MAG TPA: hypothetical protein VMG99_08950 [Thermoplasmata archaeon]|nr:hypothetical protein [Thermoplasmata archaeon]
MTTIHLGKALNEGHAYDVLVPLGHLGVFGQTRRAGKTTTLRTLIHELAATSGADALVFRTGRNEIPFPGARHLVPFFRERLDWHNVETMLWTFLGERPKQYRPLLMQSTRGAHALEDVHAKIVALGKKSPSAWVRDRTLELDQYFQEILPWVRGHKLETTLEEPDGVGVVDLEGWPLTVQQLVIAATLDRLMEAHPKGRARPLLVVLPEARRFIPSDSLTPVTRAADFFSSQGAKLNLFLWVDSQALTGVNQQILRNFALLLQGVQSSDLEISRICKALDGVKPAMVRKLKVGDFILSTDEGVRTLHIPLVEPKKEEIVDEEERAKFEREIAGLRNTVKELERHLQEELTSKAELVRSVAAEHARAEANARAAASNAIVAIKRGPRPGDLTRLEDATYDTKEPAERTKADLHVFTETPELTLHVKVVTIEANEDEHIGKLAKLLAEGFFDEKVSTGPIGKEYAARGWENPIAKGGGSGQALRAALRQLCQYGFMREFNGMFQAVREAKSRIRTVKEEVAA